MDLVGWGILLGIFGLVIWACMKCSPPNQKDLYDTWNR